MKEEYSEIKNGKLFTVKIEENSDKFNYVDGKLHNDGDNPAVEKKNYKAWYKDGIILHVESIEKQKLVLENYELIRKDLITKEWYIDGKLGREGDLPAIEQTDGTKIWYKDGKLHRDNDMPAVEKTDYKAWYKDGVILHVESIDRSQVTYENRVPTNVKIVERKEWYIDGKLGREGDLPAIEQTDGYKAWYKNGNFHREGDLPAIEMASGNKQWYKNGKLERENGLPASESIDGSKSFYKDGVINHSEDAYGNTTLYKNGFEVSNKYDLKKPNSSLIDSFRNRFFTEESKMPKNKKG